MYNHDRTGIGLVPYPEEDANDLAPSQDTWDTPCEDVRDEEVPEIPEEDCVAVEGLLEGCVVIWNPYENRVVDNVVEASGVADLAVSTVDLLGTGETTDTLRQLLLGQHLHQQRPDGPGGPGPLRRQADGDELGRRRPRPAGPVRQPCRRARRRTRTRPPRSRGEQENMPDALTAEPERFEGPEVPDIDSIEVPGEAHRVRTGR